jgi:hypothetical protein
MSVSSEHDVVSEHAAKIEDGGKSLSVLATPPSERNDDSYKLSDEARKTLAKILAEEIATDPADDH